MKKWIVWALLLAMPVLAMAQDDDLYFTPRKKQPTTTQSQLPQGVVTVVPDDEPATLQVYNSRSRDDDEYNRRGVGYQTSGGYDEATDVADDAADDPAYDDEDYYYSRRILRFRSPRVGIALSSPYYWDLVYTLGAYDYLYDPWVYDSFYWHYGWGYGWSWGPWSSWYGPFYGWHHPYHWSYWGWGPGWHGGYHGWHGGWGGRWNRPQHGVGINRFDRDTRIRTSALANGGRTFNATRSGSTLSGQSSRSSVRSSMSDTRQASRSTIGQQRGTGVRSSESYSRSRSSSSYDRERNGSSSYAITPRRGQPVTFNRFGRSVQG